MIAKPTMWWPGIRRGHPLARGLMGLWPFWDGGGGGAMDVSGNANQGVSAGPDWAGSALGTALEFNGTTDVVTVSNDNVLNPTAQITLAAWVYPTDLTTPAYPCIMGKGWDSQWAFVADYAAGAAYLGQARVILKIDGARNDVRCDSGPALNTWQLMAFTYNGAERHVYCNAAEITQGASIADTGLLGTCANDLNIGESDHAGIDGLPGQIAFAAIWNRGLGHAEVKELYEDPWGLITPRRRSYFFYQVPRGVKRGFLRGVSRGVLRGAA